MYYAALLTTRSETSDIKCAHQQTELADVFLDCTEEIKTVGAFRTSQSKVIISNLHICTVFHEDLSIHDHLIYLTFSKRNKTRSLCNSTIKQKESKEKGKKKRERERE